MLAKGYAHHNAPETSRESAESGDFQAQAEKVLHIITRFEPLSDEDTRHAIEFALGFLPEAEQLAFLRAWHAEEWNRLDIFWPDFIESF